MNLNNKFEIILLSIIIVLFTSIVFKENKDYFISLGQKTSISNNTDIKSVQKDMIEAKRVIVFYQPSCHSCKSEKQYIKGVLASKYKNVKFEYHNLMQSQELELMKSFYNYHHLDLNKMTTPSMFIGTDYLLGYEGNKSNIKIETLIKENYLSPNGRSHKIEETNGKIPKFIDTPFGRIDVFKSSLPVLAVILGLIDGFNPCAMWVLVYLISLVSQLNDKSKIWLIVGSFVLASGILYFLFMTALLNIFLYIGYLRILQLSVGCFALYIAINDLKTYFFNKNEIACKVGDAQSKTKTMTKIERIVHSKMTIMTVFAVIALAFVVNSIEFVCSAALPAIYTSVLTQAKLSMLKYYSYILIYVFFFMLDDLIIFSLAAFAIDKYIGDKYVVHCKLIAGVILFILGIIMVFFPQYLR